MKKIYLFFLCTEDAQKNPFSPYLFTSQGDLMETSWNLGLPVGDTVYPLYGWTCDKEVADIFEDSRSPDIFLRRESKIEDVDDFCEDDKNISFFQIAIESLTTKSVKDNFTKTEIRVPICYHEYWAITDTYPVLLGPQLYTMEKTGLPFKVEPMAQIEPEYLQTLFEAYDFSHCIFSEKFEAAVMGLGIHALRGEEYPVEDSLEIDEFSLFLTLYGKTLREVTE